MKSNRLIFMIVIITGSFLTLEASRPYYPGKEWKRCSPQKLGLDVMVLSKIDSLMRQANANGVLIYKGRLVADWNYGGKSDQTFEVQSITKTVTSVVLGVALKDGLIPELDVKVKDFYPAFEVGPYTEDITFRHLVTASSGIKSTITKGRYYDPDNMKPGIESRYHNDHCHQLACVLTFLYCRDLQEVLKEKILIPIQIQDTMQWGHHNSTVTCTNENEIKVVGGYAFSNWTARDLARLGYLYLQKGKWKKKQLLSPEYVKESRMPISIPVMDMNPDASPDQQLPNMTYGLTWRGRLNEQGETLWYMSGNGGQFCVVMPEYDLVMTKINHYQQRPYTEISSFEGLLRMIVKR